MKPKNACSVSRIVVWICSLCEKSAATSAWRASSICAARPPESKSKYVSVSDGVRLPESKTLFPPCVAWRART